MDIARNAFPLTDESMAEPKQLVGEYPASSVLLSFAVGCGVGLMLAGLIGSSRKPTVRERATSAAETFGRQVLTAITDALPESLAKHMPA